MLFNMLLSSNELSLLMWLSFFVFFTIRQLCIRRRIFILAYHLCLFFILFIASVIGGSVQNDAFKRLDAFILLEKSNELALARNNLQNYDSMLQIDLEEFNNSEEFRDYLRRHDVGIDRAEAISIGWLFVLLSEISLIFVQMLCYIWNRIKRKIYP